MATVNYRDTTAVGQDLGSSYMAVIEHQSDYTLSGDLYFLPVVETSETTNAVATLSKEDEDGATYEADGAKTITKTFTIMQNDLDAIRLPRLLEGKNLAWCKELKRTPDPNGDYLYEFGVGAKISQNFTTSGKSSSFPLTLNVTKNDTDVALTVISFDDTKWKGDLATLSSVTITQDYGFDYFAASPQ
jgi:hypothetical protein